VLEKPGFRGESSKFKTPAIRKGTKDRDINRKQLTRTDREEGIRGRVEDDDVWMRKREKGGEVLLFRCKVKLGRSRQGR